MQKFVYLAGPISSNPLVHTHRALRVAGRLLDMGLVPFVPHLTCFWEIVEPRPYEQWMEYDFAVIRRCDGLVRMLGDSPGADREVALAEELGLPVFHLKANDLPDAALREWATS